MDEVITDPPSFALPRPKAWVLALFVLLFFLVLGGFLIRAPLLNFLEATLAREARARGIILQVEGSHLGIGGGYTAKAFSVTFLKVLTGFRFTDISFIPFYGELIRGGLGAAVTSAAYGGKCDVSLKSPDWRFGELAGSLNCKELSIASHPALMALGVSKGALSFDLRELEVKNGALKRATGELSLFEASLPRGFSLSLPNGFSITIPPITDLSLSARIRSSSENLTISEGRYSSSLGGGVVSGTFSFPQKSQRTPYNSPHILVEGDLELTKSGKEHLSPFLLLFGRGKVKSDNVRIRVSGGLKNPMVIVEDK